MKPRDIQRLGRELYKGRLRGYTPKERKHVAEFGIDTEYYRDGIGENVLLSWQLSLDDGCQHFGTDALDWGKLYEQSVSMIRQQDRKLKDHTLFVYYCFFSTAEGQWLDITDNTHLEQFGSHQVNQRRPVTKKRSMYLFDLSLFFPGKSLSEVAKAFGLEKLDYDVANLSAENLKDADFIRYAQNDAYIVGEIGRRLRRMMLDFEGIDILLTRTPGSLASAMFRSRFINGTIKQDWTNLRRTSLHTAHGARKEAFYRGEKKLVYQYDAKSMYPNIVRMMGLLPRPEDWKLTKDLDTWLSSKGGLGIVYFRYPESCNTASFIPVLPVLCGDRLTFPLEGRSDCTTWEVSLALEQGCHVHLVKGFFYQDGVDWMAEFESEMISKREATRGTALEAVYKLLSNAVVGKMMQHSEDYDLNELLKFAAENGLPSHVFAGVSRLPIKKKLKCGTLFMPEWFSLILGAARANVARAAIKVKALQIATDCAISTEYHGTEFDIEGITYRLEAVADYVAYRASLYRVGENMRYHGANREVADIILHRFSDQPSVNYETRRIATIKQSIWLGVKYGKTMNVKRNVKLGFDGKRVLLSSGETLPLRSVLDVLDERITEYVWYEPLNEDTEKQAELHKNKAPRILAGYKFAEVD